MLSASTGYLAGYSPASNSWRSSDRLPTAELGPGGALCSYNRNTNELFIYCLAGDLPSGSDRKTYKKNVNFRWEYFGGIDTDVRMGGAITADYYLGYIYAFVGGGSRDFYRRWWGSYEEPESGGGQAEGVLLDDSCRGNSILVRQGEMVRLPCRVAKPGWVRSDVYSISGRKIRGSIIGQSGSGYPVVEWDTRDDAGRSVSAGVYLVRFATGNKAQTVRVVIK